MDNELQTAREAVETAGEQFMRAFAKAYPRGKQVRWLHGRHEQTGTVLWTDTHFGHNTTCPQLGVRNGKTGRDVRISLYDIELAEGYDRHTP